MLVLLKKILELLKKYLLWIVYVTRFNEYHISCYLRKPILITPKYISLGRNVHIRDFARIEGVSKYGNQHFTPSIIIGDGCGIEQCVHITCAKSIIIGANTAIAAHVTITDINHPYIDVNIPIEQQNIEVQEVVIGDDCKLYNGVVVLPGVHIGKHVPIGANAVVTHSIPSYCVAVGCPAYIIKRYNFEIQKWQKTDKNGNFIMS